MITNFLVKFSFGGIKLYRRTRIVSLDEALASLRELKAYSLRVSPETKIIGMWISED